MSKQLIEKLQNHKLFSHPINNFKVLETHISWVILTGKYAYKIKKPVNFGFVDFTSLEKRKYFCDLELSLNQRLTPNLYLKVLPITGTADNPKFDSDGKIIEYAIMMHEFAQEQLLTNCAINANLIKDLAKIIADFHNFTPKITNPDFLQVSSALLPFEENFTQIREFLHLDADLNQLNELEKINKDKYSKLKNILQERINNRQIRECHGDLHLGNIINQHHKPLIFDCIEFNDNFRYIDTISDASFLAMDLDYQEHSDLSNLFLNNYLAHTDDYHGLQVLNFYLTHRALVRAKVNLLSLNHADNKQIMLNYRKYLQLAHQYQLPKIRFIAITYGVSASGKSFATEQIVKQLGAISLSSDLLRKKQNISDYSNKARDRIYQQLLTQTTTIINNGFAAVIDATFIDRNHRKQFMELAKKLNVPFLIVKCSADISQLKSRCEIRKTASNCITDADFSVVQQQLANIHPLSKLEQEFILTADNNFNDNLQNWHRQLS